MAWHGGRQPDQELPGDSMIPRSWPMVSFLFSSTGLLGEAGACATLPLAQFLAAAAAPVASSWSYLPGPAFGEERLRAIAAVGQAARSCPVCPCESSGALLSDAMPTWTSALHRLRGQSHNLNVHGHSW